MKRCPFCAEEILDAAIVCKHCGRDLRTGAHPSQRQASQGIAALLSLIVPGAGQMYLGRVGRGLLWMLLTVVLYVAFLPLGVVMHIACIIAASTKPMKQQKLEQRMKTTATVLIAALALSSPLELEAKPKRPATATTQKVKYPRSAAARRAFMKATGFPHGRHGYVIDHIIPLACGGADAPWNMQWQSIAEAKAKDRIERRDCRP